jgi:hypothetical protein
MSPEGRNKMNEEASTTQLLSEEIMGETMNKHFLQACGFRIRCDCAICKEDAKTMLESIRKEYKTGDVIRIR